MKLRPVGPGGRVRTNTTSPKAWEEKAENYLMTNEVTPLKALLAHPPQGVGKAWNRLFDLALSQPDPGLLPAVVQAAPPACLISLETQAFRVARTGDVGKMRGWCQAVDLEALTDWPGLMRGAVYSGSLAMVQEVMRLLPPGQEMDWKGLADWARDNGHPKTQTLLAART